MTQGGNVLDTLVTVFEANTQPLESAFAKAAQQAQQQGSLIGDRLANGLKAGMDVPEAQGIGAKAGTQFAEGFKLDVNGKLRDSRGRFVKTGEELGEALGGGMTQGSRRGIDGLTDRLRATGQAAMGAAGGFGGMNLSLLNLNAGIQIVQQVAAAVEGLSAQVGNYAHMADGAATAARAWNTVLERMGIDGKAADATLQDLSDRTGATVENLRDSAAQFLKMGGSLDDFSKGALAAASSWYDLKVKSIDLNTAISNVTQGVAQGRSELMETAGIMTNASQAWDRYAASLGKSTKDLTDVQKAHAYALAVYKEERIGIETLAEKQTALGRAENQAANSKQKLGQTIGQTVLPAYTAMVTGSAQVMTSVTAMVAAYQRGEDGIAALTAAHPALAKAMGAVGPEGERMKAQLQGAWEALQAHFKNTFIPAMEAIGPVAQRIWSEVPRLVESAARVIQGAFEAIDSLWRNVLKPTWDAIGPTVTEAIGLVLRMLTGLLDMVGSTFKAIGQLVNGDWKGAMDTMGKMADRVGEAVGTAMKKVWDALSDLAGRAWEGAKKIGFNLKDGIIAGMSGLSVELVKQIDQAIKAMTAHMPAWAKKALGIEFMEGQRQGVIESIGGTQDAAQQRLQNRNQALPNTTTEARAFFAAIFGQESGGRYDIVNRDSGAMGRYQTMPQNILGMGWDVPVSQRAAWAKEHMGDIGVKGKGWDYEALKRDITPQEYLNNPALQESISQYKMAANLITQMRKSGGDLETSVKEAAKDWYGRGNAGAGYPTPDEYAASIWKRFQTLNGGGEGKLVLASAPATVASKPPKPTVDTPEPEDPKLAKNRAAIQKEIDQAVARGRVDVAQRALAELKRIQADELGAAQDNAAKRAQIIERTGPQIIAAENRIAARTREQAVAAAAQWAKDQLAKEGADGKVIEAERLRRVQDAYGAESAARKRAVSDQTAATRAGQSALQAENKKADEAAKDAIAQQVKLYEEVSKEEEARQKQRNAKAAESAEAARQGRIEDAKLSLKDLEDYRTQDLKTVEGNLLKTLNVEKTYAALIRDAKRKIAAAQYADDVRDAQNRNASTPDAARLARELKEAERVRNQASRAAGREATNRVGDAEEQQAEKVRGLRDEYKKLADGIRDQVRAGAFDADAKQKALEQFNAIGKAAKEAGVYENEYGVAARRSAYATIQQWEAGALLVKSSNERIAQIKAQSDLEQEVAEDTAITTTSLSAMLGELVGQGLDPRETGFVKLLDELIARGGKAAEAAKYVRNNLVALEADLGGDSLPAIAERGRRAMQAARDANAAEAPEGATLAESNANTLTGRVLDEVFNQPETAADKLKAALGVAMSGAFNDLGEAGREEFWARFDELTNDPELEGIGADLARTLLGGLSNAPEWDALKKKLGTVLDGESDTNLKTAQSAVDAAKDLAERDVDAGLGLLESTLSDLYAAAERGEDAADGINLVTAAINEMTEARAKAEAAGLRDLTDGGNLGAAKDAVSQADKLAGEGDYAGALSVLEQTLSDLYAAADRGEDAAEGINTVTEAINRLTDAQVRAKAKDDKKDKEDADKKAKEYAEGLAEAQIKVADSAEELAAAMGKTKLPFESQIDGLEALKRKYPELAKEIDDLIAKWKGLQKESQALAQFNKYADYVAQLGGAFQNVGNAIGGDTGANIAGFGKALSMTADIAKDIASKNYISAAIKLFSALGEALGGYAKANAQALKQQKDFNEQFTFIQGDDFAKTFTRSRGFFADLFGGGPEVVQEIDKVGLLFAKSMEAGFANGAKNGMSAALKMNDFGQFTKTLQQSIYDAVVDGFSEAFLKSIQSEMIGPALKAWAAALKTPGTEDDEAALAGIKTAVGDANALGQAYFNQVQPIVSGLGQEYGIDQGGMGGTDSGSMFGAAPGAQLGLQRVEVSLPESFTRALDSFTPAVGEFRSGVAEWRAINQRFDALVSQLTRPGASGLGGLT